MGGHCTYSCASEQFSSGAEVTTYMMVWGLHKLCAYSVCSVLRVFFMCVPPFWVKEKDISRMNHHTHKI